MSKNTIDFVKIIACKLNQEEYALELKNVRSIERVGNITRVPNMPEFVQGVINLRGVVTPIIDLRKKMHIKANPFNDDSRIVIISVNDMDVGLIVDDASDVIDIPVTEINEPPEKIKKIDRDNISGVTDIDDRLLIILNLNKVIDPDEIRAFNN